ncbi:RnfH family protein [Cereibacter sphaeroides]|uniref:RnfH family protein n=1 Tax=Cereibacter sphaeroides TaxID=1063 RepID=UPI000F549ABC|nr:RnfH family protein [Cereibacter sphaeroides]AZB65933.1 RnfH family protein [Cereibacter sphaeroides]AZB70693.1 RnfH family protein [Cereibacter sphaeroides]
MIVGVAYAKPTVQVWKHVDVPEGTSAREAIERSGLLAQFPEIDLAVNKVGIFGTICPLDRPLAEGDRVEIYRPIHPEAELLEKKR